MVRNGTVKSVRAEALGISRKNLYRKSKQEQKDLLLKAAIEKVHKTHPSYGHKRVAIELSLNHKQIGRVMRKYGIKPPRRKVNRFCTRSIKHRKYPNLIKDLQVTSEHQLWCSDTSELKFHGEKWYIVTIITVFTRQVLGVAIGKHHTSELVMEALEMAIATTHTNPRIFHSDQGSEFMADVITSLLEKLGTKISASDKASPWQNGYQESFFGKFKDEIGDINRFETVGELIEELYHHIHYYNTKRIHTALKMPPTVYANSLRKLSS